MTTTRTREPAEPTYRQVNELVRAGMTASTAIRQIADDAGVPFTTVQARYYSVRKRVETGAPTRATSAPAVTTRTTRNRGRTPARTARTAMPTMPPAPAVAAIRSDAVGAALDGAPLADAVASLAEAIANLAPAVVEVERDAAKWRAFVELARTDP